MLRGRVSGLATLRRNACRPPAPIRRPAYRGLPELHPQLLEDESVHIRPLGDDIAETAADSVTGVRAGAKKNRVSRRRCGLEPGGHLPRVRGIDAPVMIAGHEKNSGILRPAHHVMI